MGTDTSFSIALIIAVIGCTISLYSWYTARKKDTIAVRDEQNDLKSDFIKVNLKLDNICQNMTELRTDTKAISKDIKDMDKRITILERDQKTLWNRVDELKEDVKHE